MFIQKIIGEVFGKGEIQMGYYEDEMYLQKMEIDKNFSKHEKRKNKNKKTAKIIAIIAIILLIIIPFMPISIPCKSAYSMGYLPNYNSLVITFYNDLGSEGIILFHKYEIYRHSHWADF